MHCALHFRVIHDPRRQCWWCQCGRTMETAAQRAMGKGEFYELVESAAMKETPATGDTQKPDAVATKAEEG